MMRLTLTGHSRYTSVEGTINYKYKRLYLTFHTASTSDDHFNLYDKI